MVPGSQDSIMSGVRNLQLMDAPRQYNLQQRRRHQYRRREPRGGQRRAVLGQVSSIEECFCGATSAVQIHRYIGNTDHGLMTHISETYDVQTLTPETIAQVRQLDRGAFVVCGAIRSRRGNRCNFCRTLRQQSTTGGAASHRPPTDAPLTGSCLTGGRHRHCGVSFEGLQQRRSLLCHVAVRCRLMASIPKECDRNEELSASCNIGMYERYTN